VTGTIDLATLTLARGAHGTREDGVCLLEAVAWFAGQDHTDRPPCVSYVLAAFGRSFNDVLPDGKRQELVPLVPLLPGTAGDGQDQIRGYLALDWLIRAWTPAWLDLAGLAAEAQALRDLRRIADLAAAQAAGPVVRDARDKAAAAAAGAAAGDAAWAAAGAAAGDAAGAAAAAAAGAAAGDAAGAAAWVAAGDPAWDAAGAAAWVAAWAAARVAAWAAARVAAWAAAGAAAGAAARAALAPTVAALQDSAIGLYRAMITPGGAS
jgi:hypothetical protein